MANRVFVPGLKESTGRSEFKPLVPGRYTLKCVSCEIRDPKNPQPRDDWFFKFQVVDGPKQENGKPGKSYTHWIFIKRPEHPEYDEAKTFSVDDLKSLVLAAGVSISRNGEIDPKSFEGTVVVADIKLEENVYNGKTTMQNRVSSWASAE